MLHFFSGIVVSNHRLLSFVPYGLLSLSSFFVAGVVLWHVIARKPSSHGPVYVIAAALIEVLWWVLGAVTGERRPIWTPKTEREAAANQRRLEREASLQERRQEKEENEGHEQSKRKKEEHAGDTASISK